MEKYETSELKNMEEKFEFSENCILVGIIEIANFMFISKDTVNISFWFLVYRPQFSGQAQTIDVGEGFLRSEYSGLDKVFVSWAGLKSVQSTLSHLQSTLNEYSPDAIMAHSCQNHIFLFLTITAQNRPRKR